MAERFYVEVAGHRTDFSATALEASAPMLLRLQVKDGAYLDEIRNVLTTDDAILVWKGTTFGKGQLGFTYGPDWLPGAVSSIDIYDCKKG